MTATTEGVSRAAVQVAPKQLEIQAFPLPEVPPDGGILRVLRAGICGSDIPMYASTAKIPRILGHENVGVVEKLGALAGELWGVRVGDLVALEEYLPCGHCDACRGGNLRACQGTDFRRDDSLWYGSTRTTVWPALWGGYSQYQYLHPRAVLHKVPPGVAPRTAAMALPLGNGFQWTVFEGGAQPGSTVVVQGPGQQGLACAIAAKAAGAGTVIVSGLARDEQRLATALQLGADHTIAVDREPFVERVMELTGGKGADLVLDVSSGGATEVINGGFAVLKPRYGTLVTAAFKGAKVGDFDIDLMIRKSVRFLGARGHTYKAVELALQFMQRPTVDLALMSTHEFGLDRVDEALRLVGGELHDADGKPAIHVTIDPWMESA